MDVTLTFLSHTLDFKKYKIRPLFYPPTNIQNSSHLPPFLPIIVVQHFSSTFLAPLRSVNIIVIVYRQGMFKFSTLS